MNAEDWIRDKLKSKITNDEILMKEWVDKQTKATMKILTPVKNFAALFGDIISDDSKYPDKKTSLKERSIANKLGFEEYIDVWKNEGLI